MERIVRSSVKLAKRTASVKIVTAKHPGKRPTAGVDVGKHFCNWVLGLCQHVGPSLRDGYRDFIAVIASLGETRPRDITRKPFTALAAQSL